MSGLLFAYVLVGSSAEPEFESYRAHIAAASSALESGNSRLALEWLAGAPRRHRGWEWDHLSGRCDSTIGSFKASDAAITRVQVSPNGSTLAAADVDGTVTLWDTKTLSPKGTLTGHKAAVYGLAYSKDGAKIVTTSRDNSIRLWDGGTGKEIGVLGEHPVTPYNCAFTPDGSKVVTVGWRMHPESRGTVGLIRVWDVAERKLLHTMDYTTHPISCLTFSDDGKICYIGTWEYQVAVFNMETYKVEREILPEKSPAYKAIDWIELSEDNKTLITACKDKTVKFFDVESRKETGHLPHKGNVTSARLLADGRHLLSTSQDGGLRIFDRESLSEIANLQGHGQAVSCAAVTPDGQRAFSADSTGVVKIWDVSQPRAFAPSYEISGAWSCIFSPDGKRIAAGTNAKTIQIRDSESLALVAESPAYGSLVVDVAWSPDGSKIVGGSNDGTLRAFTSDLKTQLWKFEGKGQMRAADWSRDGRYCATGSGSTGMAHVIDAASGRVALEHKMAAGTICTAFSPDSKWVAFASAKEMVLLSLPEGKLARKIDKISSDAFDIAVSPDGLTIAVGCTSGHVELFRVRDGAKLWTQKTDGSQWGVHFSPDGRRLATTGYDFATHLWDPKMGKLVYSVRELPYQGFDVRFSPDGKRLAHMGGTGVTWILNREGFKQRSGARN